MAFEGTCWDCADRPATCCRPVIAKPLLGRLDRAQDDLNDCVGIRYQPEVASVKFADVRVGAPGHGELRGRWDDVVLCTDEVP